MIKKKIEMLDWISTKFFGSKNKPNKRKRSEDTQYFKMQEIPIDINYHDKRNEKIQVNQISPVIKNVHQNNPNGGGNHPRKKKESFSTPQSSTPNKKNLNNSHNLFISNSVRRLDNLRRHKLQNSGRKKKDEEKNILDSLIINREELPSSYLSPISKQHNVDGKEMKKINNAVQTNGNHNNF